MKRHLLFLLFTQLLSFPILAQWQPIQNLTQVQLRSNTLDVEPTQYALFELDVRQIEQTLQRARQVGQALTLKIPMPEGDIQAFEVQIHSNFAPKLAEKYGNIISFKGKNPANPAETVRGSWSPLGFSALLKTGEGEIYIDPINRYTNQVHMVYYTKHHLMSPEIRAQIQHDHSNFEASPNILDDKKGGKNSPFAKTRSANTQVELLTYTIAIAATGEYTQYWGGTKEQALSAINVALDRINEVFVTDAAIRLVLQENNDTLIYTDPNSDPYVGTNTSVLIRQNPDVLNELIGFNNYDIGHVFTNGCPVPGSVGASLGTSTVCGGSKAAGTSCQQSNNEQFYIGIIAHELGHQFGAFHTWNNCPPNNDDVANYNPNSAFEPGSGSTIMSYGGECLNGQNVTDDSDPYFHVNSLEAIEGFSRNGGGLGCAEVTVIDNTVPVVEIPLENGFFVPISTPFKLNAEASDAEDDPLTYCWEQYDRDLVISNVGNPMGNDPAFRSFLPTASPTRYFPRLIDLINNRSQDYEVLPTYNRDLTFRVTVRDNNPAGGGVDWKQVKFKSSDTAGPFIVTSQSESRTSMAAGDYFEVTWDVANTDQAPVNSQFVNIRLSLDAGLTYPIMLAENTLNDGSAFVSLPDTVADFARIMVEAADNIFFNINRFNFAITAPADTGLYVDVAPAGIPLHCQPEPLEFEVNTRALNGFTAPMNLDLLGDLPEGSTYEFSNNPVQPGETSTLQIALVGTDAADINLEVIGVAEGLDTFRRSVFFSTLSNNFDNLSQLAPADGTGGIVLSTDFAWVDADNAQAYDIEIATSPIFGDSIIESATNITDSLYQPSTFFEDNTLHFWRIRPINECGPADFLAPFTFHTASIDCTPFENKTRVNISGTGLPTIESEIEVETDGIINDLNIPFIKANYQGVNSLRVTLISPAETEVILFDQNCGATANLRLGFDDDAPNEIVCPPDDGIVFKPVNPLDTFIGENTKGTWILRVAVVRSGFGASGALEEWSLEFCATGQAINPVLVNNDTLFVPPAQFNTYTPEQLIASDEDNSSDDLVYTIVSLPAYGVLSVYDTPLSVGDRFTQRAIETFDLVYQHDGSENLLDGFSFVIDDGTGGFIPVTKAPIKVDQNAVVSTEEIIQEDTNFRLFPNPTKDLLYIQNKKLDGKDLDISIFNSQGQLMDRQIKASNALIELATNQLTRGLYLINIRTEAGIVVRRFVKQ